MGTFRNINLFNLCVVIFYRKKMMITTLILIASMANGIQAMLIGGKEIDVGQCPNITEKYDFDPAPYLGRWYEYQRFDAIFEAFNDCVNAIYSDLGDGYIQVYNAGRTPFGGLYDITGKAHLIAPGVLEVEFPGSVPGEYHVLDTDYEKFSCVYSCSQEGPLRVQYAWLLTRSVDLDEDTYNHAMQVFKDNDIDISLFHKTHQGDDCPYPE